jgi:hypothetical protein
VSNRNPNDPNIAAYRRESAFHLGEDRGTRTRAEAILARYPHLEPDELQELLFWYRRQASAMDVALVAGNARVAEAYQSFYRDHLKRFSWKERLVTGVLASGVVGLLAIGLLPEAS